MEKLSLQAIKNAVNGFGEYDCEIESICIDTRKIEPDCLYIAIKGENFDGHTFIEQALQSGANAVLSEKPIEGESRIIVVKNTKQALLDLAKYYKSLFHVFTVGVTGSVGKTSTKEMIYTILNAKGKTLRTQGNFNNEIGMPMTLFALQKEYENAVLEMGMSDFGEISALTKVCTPNVGVITNIGVSHIETLKTQENILKAKLEITQGMEHDAPLVLNADDPFLQKVVTMVDRPIIYYGIDVPADITATDIVQGEASTSFVIHYYGQSIKANIPTIGKHNIKNALAGFCVGLLADIPPEQIASSMKWYKNANMRQNVSVVNNITVIADCYNASPDSMNAAIDVISSTSCSGKRYCVLGDMLELGEISEQAHVEVGKAVARSKVDVLLCLGEQAKEIKRGAIVIGMKNVIHFEEKQSLIDYIIANLSPGDAIIYKASRGMKLEEVMQVVNEFWQEK